MKRDYGGVIWTDHALKRLAERGIKQGDAWTTWRRPDQSRYAKDKGGWIFYRTYGSERIEVVARKNGKGRWIVLSVWSRKVRRAKKKQTKSFWSNLKNLLFGES
jgi:hypothetical protein